MSWSHDRPRGQALVEFALIVPIFILLLMGILDFGRAVYAYSTLNNSAREAARQAIVDQTVEHIQTRAVEHGVALGIPVADVTVEFRDSTDTGGCVALTNADANDDPFVSNCLVRVRVDYDFTAATPVIGDIIGSVAMSGDSTMPIDVFCREPTIPSCPRGS